MAKVGRPSNYNKKIADRICELVATHPIGLKRLCIKFPDIPRECTITEWRNKHPKFAVQYTQAKKTQVELFVDELVDIADDTTQDSIVNDEGKAVFNSEFVARSRIRIDTRKWLASKLAPKLYGDKQQIETLNADNDKLKEDIAELQKMLLEQNKKEY